MTSMQADDIAKSLQHKIKIAGNKSQLNVRIVNVRQKGVLNKTSINTPTKNQRFSS
jgi:hypothetical protein